MLAFVLTTIYCAFFLYGWALGEAQQHSTSLSRFKLYHQPNVNTYEERKPLIFINFILSTALMFFAFWYFEFAFSFGSVHSLGWVLLELIFIVAIDDLWFYVYHRLVHENMWLYRHVHAIHHRVRSTMPLDYIYVHPAEWLIGALGVALACLAIYGVFGSISAYAIIGYGTLRTWHEIDIHSGIKSFVLDRVPMMGTAEHHGAHHAKFRGNYASTFKVWDKVLKTELT